MTADDHADLAPRRFLPAPVLVVDDDQAILRKVSRESLRRTNLGVLVADNLTDAAQLFESKIELGAVLIDLHFRTETHDESRNLRSGLDFLAYINRAREGLPKYVLSVDATDQQRQSEAKQRGIGVRSWFDKLSAASTQPTPWAGIEYDLVRSALLSNTELLNAAVRNGLNLSEFLKKDEVTDEVRTMLPRPRMTYLQDIEGEPATTVIKPIEVICWEEDRRYLAKASATPLLQNGEGADPVEAIEELGELLRDEFWSLSQNAPRLVGYAEYIYTVLCAHLQDTRSFIDNR